MIGHDSFPTRTRISLLLSNWWMVRRDQVKKYVTSNNDEHNKYENNKYEHNKYENNKYEYHKLC